MKDSQISGAIMLLGFVALLASVALRHVPPPPAAAVGIDLGTTFSAVGVFRTGVGSVALPPLGDAAEPPAQHVLASRVAFRAATAAFAVGRHAAAADVRAAHRFFDLKRFVGVRRSTLDAAAFAARYPFELAAEHTTTSTSDDVDNNNHNNNNHNNNNHNNNNHNNNNKNNNKNNNNDNNNNNNDNNDENNDDNDDDDLVRFNLYASDDVADDEILATPAAHELSAHVLLHLRDAAESLVGRKVRRCVIGVPVQFDARARRFTARAAELAGLETLALVHEPTLAAMAYGLHERADVNFVIVYDLGGGTLDVSLLQKESDAMFHVISSSGDTHFGGQDFNHAVRNGIVADHPTIDFDLNQLSSAVEETKKILNSDEGDRNEQLSVSLGLHDLELTRADFDRYTAALIEKATAPISQTLKAANLTGHDIDQVVMVGGSSRLRTVRNAVAKWFGYNNSSQLHTDVPPEHAVAIGATLYAARLTGQWPLPMIALERDVGTTADDSDSDEEDVDNDQQTDHKEIENANEIKQAKGGW